MADELEWIDADRISLQSQGLWRQPRTVTALGKGWCLADGCRLRSFATNDYLDLAHDVRVVAAAERALREGGAGTGSSAAISGHTRWHAQLEERLAAFENTPAAILFPSGYAANLGTISALVGTGDSVYCDRLNHASLVDGCRLSSARLRIFRHADLTGLEDALRKDDGCSGRKLIVTDSVFSMDGDLAPLEALCQLAERFGAMVLVDEAHGTGVYGSRGRGVTELAGVEDRVTVRMGTLSKALGSLGGFAAGSMRLRDWLWNSARTQIYSTALPPAACAAATAALEIIEAEPFRRQHVLHLAAELRSRLAAARIATLSGSIGPIIPIVLQAPERALYVARRLEEAGYLVGAIRPPTVPQGTSRLRITLCAAHTAEDVAGLVTSLAAALHNSTAADQTQDAMTA